MNIYKMKKNIKWIKNKLKKNKYNNYW